MLQLREVALLRNGRALLHDLTMSLAPGQAVVIKGENGSGKTTLLRTICGWRPGHRGSITWRGIPLDSARDALRAELAYLGHQDGLHDDLSARENLRWLCGMADEAPGHADLERALLEMDLCEVADKPARALSRGQRRRTALARFLLTRKPLWVLDEPLAALDVQGQQRFRSCVMRHLQAGGLALLSCHTDSWPYHSSLRSLCLPGRPRVN